MNSLHINLRLSNNDSETFSIESINVINDDPIIVSNLSKKNKTIYSNFITLIGDNNVILNDVPGDIEFMKFNRFKLFEHDENYNIIGIDSYIKSYNDYSDDEKAIIDSFITFTLNYK